MLGELGGGSQSHADETPVVDRQEATSTSSLDRKEELNWTEVWTEGKMRFSFSSFLAFEVF